MLGLVKDEKDHLEKLLELSPEAAVVQAYNQVEKLVLEIIFPAKEPHLQRYPVVMFWRLPEFSELIEYLEQNNFVSKGSLKRFTLLRDMRNQAAHSHPDINSVTDIQKALVIAKEFISGLQKAKDQGYVVTKKEENEA